MKKIMFFIASLYQGGGERVVSELSLHLPLLYHTETTILLFENRVSYPYKGKLLSLDVPLSTNPFLRFCNFFLRLFQFCNVLRKEKPDYVISLGNGANMMNILCNRKKAIPRVDLFLSESARGFWGLVYKIFVRFFFNGAQYIVSVSKAAADDLVEHYGVSEDRIRIIYNPVDIERIQALSKESLPLMYQEAFTHDVIITMGRLTKQKGQWHLISAFRKVKESVSNAKLFILGDGELRDFLQNKAKEYALEHDVYFPGFQKNPFPFLAHAKLFVLSSFFEGLPDVLLEAMACGLPIVSTDCNSGPREILAPSTNIHTMTRSIEYGEYGVLVPVVQEQMLGEAIIEILQNHGLEKAFGEKARKRAEDFRIESIIKKWDFLFQ